MSKLVNLVDFQVYARPSGIDVGQQRSVNHCLFVTYEPVRLWLKERRVHAPFRKLVVSLTADAAAARWHGTVTNAVGICEVTEVVDAGELYQRSAEHTWVLRIVSHALSCVAAALRWNSAELERLVETLSATPQPIVHSFEALARTDTVTGLRCTPWLSVEAGKTLIGIRVDNRDIIVASSDGPLFVEDTFPMVRSVIRGRNFVLQDKGGNTLAAVALDSIQ